MKLRKQIRPSLAKAISFSVFLHLLIVLIIMHRPSLRHPKVAAPPTPMEFVDAHSLESKTVATTIAPTLASRVTPTASQRRARTGQRNHTPSKWPATSAATSARTRAVAITELLPKLGDFGALQRSEITNSSQENGGSNSSVDDDPTVKWGAGAAEFQRVSDYALMHRIYERTDDALFYPGVLAAHKVSGIVTSRLVIESEGHCDWSRSTITSSDPHLRIYVLSVVKGVCLQNYARFLRGRKSTNVDLYFNFAITEHNDKNIAESQQRIVGNVLAFYRNSQHSLGEWQLGPFKGMFPIPMIGVDFGWLAENWDRVINKKDVLQEADKDLAN